jgi:hypothetical protein
MRVPRVGSMVHRRLRWWSAAGGAALVLMLSASGRAGDPPAHSLIATKACGLVQAAGNPLTDRNNFPAANACGPWAAMPDNWGVRYHGNGNAVDKYTAVGPDSLLTQQQQFLGNNVETHLAALSSHASMVGMWTHFISHGVNNQMWGTARTGQELMTDAQNYLNRMARGNAGAKWCPQNATDEFFRRVVASTHFVGGDGRCKHHDGGNANCDPSNDPNTPACATFVEGLLDNAAAGPRTLACDSEVYYPRAITMPRFRIAQNGPIWQRVQIGTQQVTTTRLTYQVHLIRQLGRVAFGARAGLERLIGHHCQRFNGNIACRGAGLNGGNQTQDPQYCECEIWFNPPNNVNGKNDTAGNGANTTYVDSRNNITNEGTTTQSRGQIQAGINFYNGLCNARPRQACNVPADCNQFCGVPSGDPFVVVTPSCEQ